MSEKQPCATPAEEQATEPITTQTSDAPATEAARAEQSVEPALEAAAAPAPAAAAAAEEEEEEHPFETDPGDHAETPFEAYEHLDLLLTRLAKRLGTTKAALRIYDPYYCEGRMVQHMSRLGYESVYNRNEDFYAVKAAGKCPEYDVLVTNPPFSGDHMERIFRFAVKSNKPWFLLIPQYVSRKAFFLEWLNNQRPKGMPKPCYVAPTRTPYMFTAPNRADVREMRVKEQAQGDSNTQHAAAAAAAAAAEASLSALSLQDSAPAAAAAGAEVTATQGAAASEATAAAPTAPAEAAAAAGEATTAAGEATAAAPAAAAPSEGGPSKVFEVAAGSFQCVWFFSMGERHHKAVYEWVQQQQQQQQAEQIDEDSDCAGPGYRVVSLMKDVPQLMAAPKMTPAERRWRKKQQTLLAAGAQPPDNDEQQQQQAGPGGRSGGRQGGGRQQQQQGVGGRPSGRQQQNGRRQQQQGGRGQQQQQQGSRPGSGRQRFTAPTAL